MSDRCTQYLVHVLLKFAVSAFVYSSYQAFQVSTVYIVRMFVKPNLNLVDVILFRRSSAAVAVLKSKHCSGLISANLIIQLCSILQYWVQFWIVSIHLKESVHEIPTASSKKEQWQGNARSYEGTHLLKAGRAETEGYMQYIVIKHEDHRWETSSSTDRKL